jgi:hypothetical protein
VPERPTPDHLGHPRVVDHPGDEELGAIRVYRGGHTGTSGSGITAPRLRRGRLAPGPAAR